MDTHSLVRFDFEIIQYCICFKYVLSCNRMDGEEAIGVRAVAWLSDGERVVSTGDDGVIRVWHVRDGRTGATYAPPLHTVTHRRHALSALCVCTVNGKDIIVLSCSKFYNFQYLFICLFLKTRLLVVGRNKCFCAVARKCSVC